MNLFIFGFLHTTPQTKQDKEIDYKKELDRLYKKEFPIPIKDNDNPNPNPNVNEVKKLHELINDNVFKNKEVKR